MPQMTRAAFIGAFAACTTLLTTAAVLPRAAVAANPPAPAKKKAVHPQAKIETAKGQITIKLYPEEAPNTVANFIELARKGFYNGLVFHRVEPGFVIQGGDPKGDGSGGPGYAIKNETNKLLKHNRGAFAMANAGRDTAGSQFYIVITKPAPHLDNGNYTIFGQVIAGQDVAEKIAKGDKINKITITNAPTPYPVKVQKIPEHGG